MDANKGKYLAIGGAIRSHRLARRSGREWYAVLLIVIVCAGAIWSFWHGR